MRIKAVVVGAVLKGNFVARNLCNVHLEAELIMYVHFLHSLGIGCNCAAQQEEKAYSAYAACGFFGVAVGDIRPRIATE